MRYGDMSVEKTNNSLFLGSIKSDICQFFPARFFLFIYFFLPFLVCDPLKETVSPCDALVVYVYRFGPVSIIFGNRHIFSAFLSCESFGDPLDLYFDPLLGS